MRTLIKAYKKEMIEAVETYYREIYILSKTQLSEISKENLERKITNVNSYDMPDINEDEIRKAISDMKRSKAPGKDNIIPELIKEGGEELIKYLKVLFNK